MNYEDRDDAPTRQELAAEAMDERCMEDDDYAALEAMLDYIHEHHKVTTLAELIATIRDDQDAIRADLADADALDRDPERYYGAPPR